MSYLKEKLEALGFDRCVDTFDGGVAVRCSQCAAMIINGEPTHELKCPNAKRECNGCTAIIPFNRKYCEDCE